MRWWKLELHAALELADEILAIAEDAKDPAMLLASNSARGTTLLISASWSLRMSTWRRRWPFSTSGNPFPWSWRHRVSSFSYLYFGLSGLGYPDRAWAKSREMLEVAQRSSDPYVLAQASCFAAIHNLIRGDSAAAQKHAEEAMALTEEMGLVSFSAMATTVWRRSDRPRALRGGHRRDAPGHLR